MTAEPGPFSGSHLTTPLRTLDSWNLEAVLQESPKDASGRQFEVIET